MSTSDSNQSDVDIASYIDHTLLAVQAGDREVELLCADAITFKVAAVCVSPTKVPVAVRAVGGQLPVASVCGFPSGAHPSTTKIADAVYAVETGAAEVDMVLNLGLVNDGRWSDVEADVQAVRDVAPSPVVLKVIIESAILSDEEIVACCAAAEQAGADFVKTSTGFHPAGGASLDAVRLMAETVGGRLGVKASGGIRTRKAALDMIAAGATRLGTSSTEKILKG